MEMNVLIISFSPSYLTGRDIIDGFTSSITERKSDRCSFMDPFMVPSDTYSLVCLMTCLWKAMKLNYFSFTSYQKHVVRYCIKTDIHHVGICPNIRTGETSMLNRTWVLGNQIVTPWERLILTQIWSTKSKHHRAAVVPDQKESPDIVVWEKILEFLENNSQSVSTWMSFLCLLCLNVITSPHTYYGSSLIMPRML